MPDTDNEKGGGAGGDADAAKKPTPPDDASQASEAATVAAAPTKKRLTMKQQALQNAAQGKGPRRRRDGTANKMSFDVDELEEGLYFQVEDEEDFEEVIEYEEIPEKELAGTVDEAEVERAKLEAARLAAEAKAKAALDDASGYKIRPDLTQKFRPGAVQVIIERAIKDKLEEKEYNPEECEEWVKQINEDVHEKVKSQNYKRYKIITQITMGERRGEGASSATRCLWDAEADCMATYTFLNDSIFCNGTVYGIYFY